MVLADELNGHLLRLTVWSVLSLAVGVVGLARDRRSGFAAMTFGWAAVNLLIVLASRLGAPPTDLGGFRRFLGFNLVLNLVWISIGGGMARARPSGAVIATGASDAQGVGADLPARTRWIRAAGLAMMIQGVVLQALDLLLYIRITL